MIVNTVEDAITQLRHIQLASDYPPKDIAHMILARGPAQNLYSLPQGMHKSALEFLCRDTRNVPNYPIAGGIIKEDDKGRAYFVNGTEKFPCNEHDNEILGMLAAAGVHFPTTLAITNRGDEKTLSDMADRAMQTFERVGNEPGWSLQLFSVYPGVKAEWTNDAGESWTVEKILQEACKIPYGKGSCMGTHVLEGIAFAVSRYCMEQDIEPNDLQGSWLDAYEYVRNAIRLMIQNQRYDGSIDRCWFRKKKVPRSTIEWKEKARDLLSRRFQPARGIIYPTGHCMDAVSSMAMFLTQDRGWIDSACYIMAQTIQTQWVQLGEEISPLAHAVHALKLLDS